MTAETAVVLPVLVAVVLGLLWVVSVGIAQIRVVDAARETARAAARDEEPETAVRLGRTVAPEGSQISVKQVGQTITVTVVAEIRGPGDLFRFLPSLDVTGQAVAAKEPS